MIEFSRSIEFARAAFDPEPAMRVQVFSMAWYKGRVLAMGQNKPKTHPLNLINILRFNTGEIHRNKCICAELNLFLKLKRTTNVSFDKLTICNVRLDKNGQIKNSRPCLSCDNLLKYTKPKKLFYTNEGGNWEEYLY